MEAVASPGGFCRIFLTLTLGTCSCTSTWPFSWLAPYWGGGWRGREQSVPHARPLHCKLPVCREAGINEQQFRGWDLHTTKQHTYRHMIAP